MKKNITFWGSVGGVMTALKLKQNWDDYRAVPSEEDGMGPVALRSPLLEGEDLHEGMTLDTEIPMPRPQRKRKDCCVCCGMRCGLFWKAFGIVCLVFFGWQAIKLVIWLLTPTPTGLEDMPEFGSSVGCANAPYIYNGEPTTYSVALGENGDHTVELRRAAAVGTVTIADGPSDQTDVKIEMTLRTTDKSLLDSVIMAVPSPEDIADGMARSEVALTTVAPTGASCMRYDVVVRVPQAMKKLSIMTRAVAQVQFAPEAQISLDSLFVTMYGESVANMKNMLLPHANLRAKDLRLEMTRGWLVGEASIVDKTTIVTQSGDALANVKVYPVPANDEDASTAYLETTTGAGRTDIFYINDLGAPHRPISSRHISARNGDVYLTYKDAEFNGTLEVKAKSWTATHVENTFSKDGTAPWVGSADGGDSLLAQSNSGWMGLYF